MEKKKMQTILRTAQINHTYLTKKLSSSEGKKIIGKWVAVAKKQLISSGSRTQVLREIKRIEPNRELILVVHIPSQKHQTLSFGR